MNPLSIAAPNDAWIFHREEVNTLKEGNCNVYVLLDAYSRFCFGHVSSLDLPSIIELENLLKCAHLQVGRWPKQIFINSKDPYIDDLKSIGKKLIIEIVNLPYKDLHSFVKDFSERFMEFKRNGQPLTPLSPAEEAERRAFIPDTYSPCPCASGKKFKFCCQKIFDDIVYAMNAVEEGNLEEALYFMQKAESKVGLSAEVLCRYAICWTEFDQEKYQEYLRKALKENPNHPRTNYILGIDAAAREDYSKAVIYYQKAIEHYPKEDKFHLNEAYGNLGGVYFAMKQYEEAKQAWEKALMLLPSDTVAKENLVECIYENPDVPKHLQEVSPFISKYFAKHAAGI